MVIYTNRNLCSVSIVAAANVEPDTIEFLGPGDSVLGGAVWGNVAVFFSKLHGLVSVLPSDFSPHDMNR
jgi:alpha-D-ribose 1-methylphosphonate 5-triphosphate diphosphatase PhnM